MEIDTSTGSAGAWYVVKILCPLPKELPRGTCFESKNFLLEPVYECLYCNHGSGSVAPNLK
jgi:hypothetical protein